MLPSQEALMLNGADCPLHYHSQDRIPTHDTLNALEAIAKQQVVTGNSYSATEEDDFVLVSQYCVVTLPVAKNGKEIEVVKTFPGSYIKILPTGTDTIIGDTSVIVYDQWTALRFKAITGGWIII